MSLARIGGLGDDTVDLTPFPGGAIDSEGNIYGTPPFAPSGGGFNITDFLKTLTGGAIAGAQIYKTTQNPSVIPGSNLVYDPATGRMIPASGVGVYSPIGSAGLGGVSPLMLILVGGLLLVMVAGKK